MNSRKIKYVEYLNSEKWHEKRKQKAIEQDYTCEKCGKVVLKGFHIHHKTYAHLGNEPLTDLQFLCANCHKDEHCRLRAIKNNKKINKLKKKKKKAKNKKTCNNCLYSQIVNRKIEPRKFLYCNKKCDVCEGVCSFYRKGIEKILFKPQKKKSRRTHS